MYKYLNTLLLSMPKYKATFEKITNNVIIVEAENDVQAHYRAKEQRMKQIEPKKITIEEVKV